MTYVIKLKRTTKGFENPDEAAELATSNLAYGEAAFLNKYGYIVVGRSGGTTTVGNATRVFKAIPKSMADNGLFYSEYDSDKKFVNTQIVLYNNDDYSASSYTVYPRTKFDAVTDSNNVTLTNRIDAKMNKENPTGTGTLSINRDSSGSYLTGTNSVAVGYQNVATSNSAFAEGYQTKAQGLYSHAEGYQTTAGAQSSHAEGNTTNASGQNSHAEGNATTASGLNSHAEGLGTIAQGQNQSVSGKYNVADTSNTFATIIGNGTSTSKSNAAAIDWNGNLYLKGNVYVGGSSANATGGNSLGQFANDMMSSYIWRKYKQTVSYTTTSLDEDEFHRTSNGSGATTYTIVFGDLSVTSTGGFQLVNTKSYTYSYSNITALQNAISSGEIVNKYYDVSSTNDVVYKVTSSSSVYTETHTSPKYVVGFTNVQRLQLQTNTTSDQLLNSFNQNAYPTGVSGGYIYDKLGQLQDLMPKMQQFSYVGDDSDTLILNFKFVPKFVFVSQRSENYVSQSGRVNYLASGFWQSPGERMYVTSVYTSTDGRTPTVYPSVAYFGNTGTLIIASGALTRNDIQYDVLAFG